jgi:hypothetical protein
VRWRVNFDQLHLGNDRVNPCHPRLGLSEPVGEPSGPSGPSGLITPGRSEDDIRVTGTSGGGRSGDPSGINSAGRARGPGPRIDRRPSTVAGRRPEKRGIDKSTQNIGNEDTLHAESAILTVRTCETSIIVSEISAHGHGAGMMTRGGPGSAFRARGHGTGTGTQTFPILGSNHLSLCSGARRRPPDGETRTPPSPLCPWPARGADLELPRPHQRTPIHIHILSLPTPWAPSLTHAPLTHPPESPTPGEGLARHSHAAQSANMTTDRISRQSHGLAPQGHVTRPRRGGHLAAVWPTYPGRIPPPWARHLRPAAEGFAYAPPCRITSTSRSRAAEPPCRLSAPTCNLRSAICDLRPATCDL